MSKIYYTDRSVSMKSMKLEIKDILANRLKLITLAAIIILPLIYGALYLWAFWDPYAKINQVPVAIVNQDQCAKRDQETVCVGDELVEELKKNAAMDWHFVIAQDAQIGLNNLSYYSIVTIPSNFSSQIASADSDQARPATINIQTRQASSFMASKFVDSAAEKIKESVNDSLSKNYFKVLFSETRRSASDLQAAVDGAHKINSGLEETESGNQSLSDNLHTAYTGSQDLNNGLDQLFEGSKKLYNGFSVVQDGKSVSYLQGTIDLATGSASLKNGTETLRDSLSQFQIGLNELNIGNDLLATGAGQVASGLQQTQNGLNNSALALQASTALLEKFAVAHPEATSSSDFQQALAMLQQANSGVQTLASSSGQLIAGQQQVYGGLLKSGTELKSLQNANGQLLGGANSLVSGAQTLASGADNIKTASQDLASGTKDLRDHLSDAKKGASSLVSGLQQLEDGSHTLANALQKLTDGTASLKSQLATAVQSIFIKTETNKTELEANIMSQPVELNNQSIALVVNNGTGFAPYFMPLALWVGAMAIFFLIEPNLTSPTLLQVTDKLVLVHIIGVVQAIVLDAVLVNILHLAPLSFSALLFFSIIMSWCFVSLQYYLTMLFAEAGKFIAILLLMLQLTGSAGSYPYETLPGFFQKIHPFLPMTYAVKALREIISGGNWQIINQQIMILCGVWFFFILAINGTYFIKSYRIAVDQQRK